MDNESQKSNLSVENVFDHSTEATFDRFVRLAKELFDVPMAFISILESERPLLVSKCGLRVKNKVVGDVVFSGHTLVADDVLLVPNARYDTRFENHPLVIGDPHIGFFLGKALSDSSGKKVGTFKSLSLIARETGAAVLPMASYRESMGHHVLKFSDPLEWIEDPDPDTELYENTRQYNRIIEDMILEHPDQWIWAHRRWKVKSSN